MMARLAGGRGLSGAARSTARRIELCVKSKAMPVLRRATRFAAADCAASCCLVTTRSPAPEGFLSCMYNEHDDPIPPALDHRHGARTTQQPSDHAAALRASELGVRSAASIAAGYAVGACAMSNTMAARDASRHTPWSSYTTRQPSDQAAALRASDLGVPSAASGAAG